MNNVMILGTGCLACETYHGDGVVDLQFCPNCGSRELFEQEAL